MDELVFKIALEHIEGPKEEIKVPYSLREKYEAILEIVDKIKDRSLTDKKELYAFLKVLNISSQEFIRIVKQLLHMGPNAEDIIKSFGEEGIRIIDDSWFSRNIDDVSLIKRVPSKYWKRFRDPAWVTEYIKEH